MREARGAGAHRLLRYLPIHQFHDRLGTAALGHPDVVCGMTQLPEEFTPPHWRDAWWEAGHADGERFPADPRVNAYFDPRAVVRAGAMPTSPAGAGVLTPSRSHRVLLLRHPWLRVASFRLLRPWIDAGVAHGTTGAGDGVAAAQPTPPRVAATAAFPLAVTFDVDTAPTAPVD